jgi:hypothetical protein
MVTTIRLQQLKMGWCSLLLVGLLCVSRSNTWTTPAIATWYYNRSQHGFGWLMEKNYSSTEDADHDVNTVVQVVVEP